MANDVDRPHGHTAEEERRIQEATLDETLAQSFPASDPLSTNPNPHDDSAVAPPAGRAEEDSGRIADVRDGDA